eukprot:8512987-Lingulodinium_polyedra.AAC.1
MVVGHSSRLDHVPVVVRLARAGPAVSSERRMVRPQIEPALLDDACTAAAYEADLEHEFQEINAGADVDELWEQIDDAVG